MSERKNELIFFGGIAFKFMEISFSTKEFRKLCEDRNYADEKLGTVVADILRRRLADLRAATNIDDIVLGNPSIVTFGNDQRYILEMDKYGTLCFEPNNVRNFATEGGAIEWAIVSRLQLVDMVLVDD